MEQDDVRGTAPGDSGGPVLWEEAPAGPWRAPPIGVASIESDVYASLFEPFNLDFVRARIDRDGDGRFDNACGTGFDPASTPENDSDGDGILDAVDNCTVSVSPTPAAAYNPCQEDRDFDGVGDNCDTCPDHRNPGAAQHLHSDATRDRPIGDGIPDACDNCPLHDNPGQEDGDVIEWGPFAGTVARDGAGDACDNCEGVFNPGPVGGQLNCNADAEIAMGLFEPGVVGGETGTGDACDPIPCGETRLGTRSTLEDRGGRDARVYRPTLLVDPLATPVFAAGLAGFRFCRCSVATRDAVSHRRACVDPIPGDDTGGCLIANNPVYDDDSRESETWRLVSVVRADGSVDLRSEALLDFEPAGAGFVPELDSDWRFEDDLFRWTLPPPLGFGETIPTPTAGMLWTPTRGHLVRERGGPVRAAFPEGSSQYSLAHHYYSGRVDPESVVFAPRPDPCFDFIGPFLFDQAFCPTCSTSFPLPWIGRSGSVLPGCPPDLGLPAVMLAEAMLEAGPSFASDPTPLLDADGTWVAASEPGPWLPLEGLRYAAVLPGGIIERLLVQTPFGIADGTQPPACPNCDTVPFTLSAAPTSEPVLVLSARRSLLWILDGGTMLVRDVASGLSRPLADDEVPLGRVLAASYDPAADRLAILDESTTPRSGSHRAIARLLSVHPLTGEIVVVLEVDRARPTTRFAIAPDGRGGLWLAASGEFDGHAVVHVAAPWTLGPITGWRNGHGTLASSQARGDARGLSLAVIDGDRTQIVGHAIDDLHRGGAGALHRCF